MLDKQTISLIRRLRHATGYALDLIYDNCDCGQCEPCRKARSLERLYKEAREALKQDIAEAGTIAASDTDVAGLWACECDHAQKEAGAVCRYCREKLGRHKPSDPMPSRVVALFNPQVWINGAAVDTGPAIPFDVTDQIVAMGKEKALGIKNNRDESDRLVPGGLTRQHAAQYGHRACFWVEVEDAIPTFYEEI